MESRHLRLAVSASLSVCVCVCVVSGLLWRGGVFWLVV